jgi:hypothetical protein
VKYLAILREEQAKTQNVTIKKLEQQYKSTFLILMQEKITA